MGVRPISSIVSTHSNRVLTGDLHLGLGLDIVKESGCASPAVFYPAGLPHGPAPGRREGS
ncbi:hypothetical protein QO014_004400 [Kaistia dalseonensis]|uniref:Uncharacterized protein n=1 Tax=Kaistia dalseonensis TaxID=410840 RepID=A0ABU0HCE7_9HYPH|nr:hypothetical protein [Kaistia dalseonensis]